MPSLPSTNPLPRLSIQSLTLFFAPLLLPKALTYYRSLRSTPRTQIRPLPQKTSHALAILFLSGLLAFLSTLPVFHPENVFRATQSRLQTPAGVLMTRLSSLHAVGEWDERLRSVLDAGGLEARLLYARFGPRVLVDCPLAKPGDLGAAKVFLLYAAPGILAPHLLHLLALGVATSTALSGREGGRWRTVAAIAGVVLGAAEFWFVAAYDDRVNQRSTRLNEVDFVYWKVLVWRGLAIAALDAALGWVVWLQATGRAFLSPTPPAERLVDHTKKLEAVLAKTRSLGILRNGVVRDAGLRAKVEAYWVKEGEVMKDVFEEPEVLEAQRAALRRIDMEGVRREAEGFLGTVFGETGPRVGDGASLAAAGA